MAKNLLRIGASTDATAGLVNGVAGATRYFGFKNLYIGANATETNRVMYPHIACTAIKMWVWVAANAATANSTVRFRKELADVSGASITIGAGATGYFEASGFSESILAGDRLNMALDNGTGGVVTISGAGILVDYPDGSGQELYIMDWDIVGAVVGTAGTTTYFLLQGIFADDNATETNRVARLGVPGTIKKFFIRVLSNAATADSTIVLRKELADTALSITVGAGATGNFLVSGSVSVADNDRISIKLVNGTGGALTIIQAGIVMEVTAVD